MPTITQKRDVLKKMLQPKKKMPPINLKPKMPIITKSKISPKDKAFDKKFKSINWSKWGY